MIEFESLMPPVRLKGFIKDPLYAMSSLVLSGSGKNCIVFTALYCPNANIYTKILPHGHKQNPRMCQIPMIETFKIYKNDI